MTWQDYFDACRDNDIWKAFESLAAVGVLPIVVGEADKAACVWERSLSSANP